MSLRYFLSQPPALGTKSKLSDTEDKESLRKPGILDAVMQDLSLKTNWDWTIRKSAEGYLAVLLSCSLVTSGLSLLNFSHSLFCLVVLWSNLGFVHAEQVLYHCILSHWIFHAQPQKNHVPVWDQDKMARLFSQIKFLSAADLYPQLLDSWWVLVFLPQWYPRLLHKFHSQRKK